DLGGDPRLKDSGLWTLAYAQNPVQGAQAVAYKGLLETLFEGHLIVARVAYDGDIDRFFPLGVGDTYEARLAWDLMNVPKEEGVGVTGTVRIEAVRLSTVEFGPCRYEGLVVRMQNAATLTTAAHKEKD